jgi:hypothetical protein
MTMAAPQSVVELEVPALVDPPAVGGGCCFVTLDEVVRNELLGWYGVEDAEIKGARVRLRVADRHPPVSDLLDAVRSLGISDVRVVQAPDREKQ